LQYRQFSYLLCRSAISPDRSSVTVIAISIWDLHPAAGRDIGYQDKNHA